MAGDATNEKHNRIQSDFHPSLWAHCKLVDVEAAFGVCVQISSCGGLWPPLLIIKEFGAHRAPLQRGLGRHAGLPLLLYLPVLMLAAMVTADSRRSLHRSVEGRVKGRLCASRCINSSTQPFKM